MEYFLTQKIAPKITKSIADRTVRERTAQKDDSRVQPISVYNWVFWVCGFVGLILGGLACIFGQIIAGFCLFALFGLISVPGLCIQYNCLITYDKEGFTWHNMLRMSHRYSYEDVTGIYISPLHVVVEIGNRKRLDLDADWVNQHNFAEAINQYRSKKPPKLPLPVLGMSSSEISTSYECGVLSRAMLVKAKDLPKFVWFKGIHYGVCTLSCVFVAFAMLSFPAFQDAEMLSGLLILALPGVLCMAAAFLLYFRYPQYFTAREKASDVNLSKKTKASHKRCTLALVSTLGVLGAWLFFLAQLKQQTIRCLPLLLAAGVAVLLLWVFLTLFRRFSWEYRNFWVGYVSFIFWQVFSCLSAFFIMGGIFLALWKG